MKRAPEEQFDFSQVRRLDSGGACSAAFDPFSIVDRASFTGYFNRAGCPRENMGPVEVLLLSSEIFMSDSIALCRVRSTKKYLAFPCFNGTEFGSVRRHGNALSLQSARYQLTLELPTDSSADVVGKWARVLSRLFGTSSQVSKDTLQGLGIDLTVAAPRQAAQTTPTRTSPSGSRRSLIPASRSSKSIKRLTIGLGDGSSMAQDLAAMLGSLGDMASSEPEPKPEPQQGSLLAPQISQPVLVAQPEQPKQLEQPSLRPESLAAPSAPFSMVHSNNSGTSLSSGVDSNASPSSFAHAAAPSTPSSRVSRVSSILEKEQKQHLERYVRRSVVVPQASGSKLSLTMDMEMSQPPSIPPPMPKPLKSNEAKVPTLSVTAAAPEPAKPSAQLAKSADTNPTVSKLAVPPVPKTELADREVLEGSTNLCPVNTGGTADFLSPYIGSESIASVEPEQPQQQQQQQKQQRQQKQKQKSFFSSLKEPTKRKEPVPDIGYADKVVKQPKGMFKSVFQRLKTKRRVDRPEPVPEPQEPEHNQTQVSESEPQHQHDHEYEEEQEEMGAGTAPDASADATANPAPERQLGQLPRLPSIPELAKEEVTPMIDELHIDEVEAPQAVPTQPTPAPVQAAPVQSVPAQQAVYDDNSSHMNSDTSYATLLTRDTTNTTLASSIGDSNRKGAVAVFAESHNRTVSASVSSSASTLSFRSARSHSSRTQAAAPSIAKSASNRSVGTARASIVGFAPALMAHAELSGSQVTVTRVPTAAARVVDASTPPAPVQPLATVASSNPSEAWEKFMDSIKSDAAKQADAAAKAELEKQAREQQAREQQAKLHAQERLRAELAAERAREQEAASKAASRAIVAKPELRSLDPGSSLGADKTQPVLRRVFDANKSTPALIPKATAPASATSAMSALSSSSAPNLVLTTAPGVQLVMFTGHMWVSKWTKNRWTPLSQLELATEVVVLAKGGSRIMVTNPGGIGTIGLKFDAGCDIRKAGLHDTEVRLSDDIYMFRSRDPEASRRYLRTLASLQMDLRDPSTYPKVASSSGSSENSLSSSSTDSLDPRRRTFLPPVLAKSRLSVV